MKVQSSTIAEIDHAGKTLIVSFTNGRVYTYDDVPRHIYEAFIKSESKGQYFHENINGRYNFNRIK